MEAARFRADQFQQRPGKCRRRGKQQQRITDTQRRHLLAPFIDAALVAVGGRRTASTSSKHAPFLGFAYPGSQDTFYVGTLKGVGRIYQQTFVDTYSKVAFAKLYTTKTPITAADLLNDRVLPFFAEHGMGILRMLTDRGTEYCGKAETHDYQLYLALNDIEHTKTKARHPQTNGICERFHKTILQEFYQIAFRRKLYLTLDELQHDLDAWLTHYNGERTHQGKMCCGRTPMQTLIEGKIVRKEKVDTLN